MRISDWSSDVCSSDLGDLLMRFQVGDDRPGGEIGNDCSDRHAQINIFCALAVTLRAAAAFAALGAMHALEAVIHQGVDVAVRSEERRVGKEWGSTCSIRWAP